MSKYWSDALVPKGHYSDHAYKMLNDPEYAYKHGISETEERIIKLLEEEDSALFDDYKNNYTGAYGEGLSDGVTKAIALIKGEK